MPMSYSVHVKSYWSNVKIISMDGQNWLEWLSIRFIKKNFSTLAECARCSISKLSQVWQLGWGQVWQMNIQLSLTFL